MYRGISSKTGAEDGLRDEAISANKCKLDKRQQQISTLCTSYCRGEGSGMPSRWLLPPITICIAIWFGFQLVLLRHFNSHLAVAPESQHHTQQHDHDLNGRLSKYNLTLSSLLTKKKSVSDNDRVNITFLHIGKTSGSTISVNIRRGCHECCMQACIGRTDGWTLNETIASQRIQSYYHKEFIPGDKLKQTTTIVTAVRNPISRFISAFAYEHPLNGRTTKLIHIREVWEQFSVHPRPHQPPLWNYGCWN